MLHCDQALDAGYLSVYTDHCKRSYLLSKNLLTRGTGHDACPTLVEEQGNEDDQQSSDPRDNPTKESMKRAPASLY